MLVAASIVGAAIAGLIIYRKSDIGSLKSKTLRDQAKKMLMQGNGHPQRSSIQTMG